MAGPTVEPRGAARWPLLFSVLLLALVAGLLTAQSRSEDPPIREGEPAPRTVIAPETLRVVDEEATERARRAAAEDVDPVTNVDREAQDAILGRVDDAFAAVADAREPVVDTNEDQGDDEDADAEGDPEPLPREDQIELVAERLDLSRAGAAALVDLDDRELDDLASQVRSIVRDLVRQRLTDGDVDDAVAAHLNDELPVYRITGTLADRAVGPLVADAMEPTVRVDEDATEDERQNAADAVDDVSHTFPAGTPVVTAGEDVTDTALQALGYTGLTGADPLQTAGESALLMLASGALIAGAAVRLRRDGTPWQRTMLLGVSLLTVHALLTVTIAMATDDRAWLFLAPVAGIGALSAVAVGLGFAVALAVPAALLLSYVAGGDVTVAAGSLSSTLLAVAAAGRIRSRTDLRRAAGWALAATVAGFSVTAAIFDPSWELLTVAGAAGGGLASGLLLLGGLPVLESGFGIATPTSLLDLADRNHPLLQELETDALGTLNHSVQVATLASRASRTIGADPLLASAMALYHDVGKLERPGFFAENQAPDHNPHDDLSPQDSAAIIHAHVPDGVRRAREHRLPEAVIEGIASHHGTSLVAVFYHAANAANAGGAPVDEATFRYDGPLPVSREASVVMLADGCESAARAAARSGAVDRETIERIVHGIVDDRVRDGQLSASRLSFADVEAVRGALIDGLSGIHHPRIRYPDGMSASESR